MRQSRITDIGKVRKPGVFLRAPTTLATNHACELSMARWNRLEENVQKNIGLIGLRFHRQRQLVCPIYKKSSLVHGTRSLRRHHIAIVRTGWVWQIGTEARYGL